MQRRFGMLIASIALLLLVGAGCAVTQDAEDAATNGGGETSTEPIKVGFIGPLTGDAVVYGEPAKEIQQMAVDEINEAGGVNGRMLELIIEDGKCNGKDATAAMNKLVNVDQVKYVLGGLCSGETLAAAPLANDNNVVLISGGSTSPDLTTDGGAYFFRTIPSDANQGKVLAELAYNTNEWKKVGAIQEQTDYATGFYKAFADRFEELGGEITVEAFPSNSTDFRTALTKLKAGEPDALLVSVQAPAPSALILKQAKELGWNLPTVGIDAIVSSDLVSTEAALYEGMYGAIQSLDEDNETLKRLVDGYKARYNAEEVPFLNYGQAEYDAVYLLAEAIGEVGDDSVKVRQWFLDVDGWVGAMGATAFDDNGDRAIGGHTIVQIVNGEAVPLAE